MAAVGWSGDVGKLGKGLYQITGWTSDKREMSESPSASGFSAVAQQELGNGWVPYARYAWSSDAAVAMELGATAVLMNTGIAAAKEPLKMARAMKLAIEAGRLAYEAGRMPRRLYASASSPMDGLASF